MTPLSLLSRARSVAEPVDCPRCLVTYRPGLTAGTCPVCDTEPGGEPGSVRAPRDLLMPIVAVATAVNVVLLLGLAVLVARVG